MTFGAVILVPLRINCITCDDSLKKHHHIKLSVCFVLKFMTSACKTNDVSISVLL